MKYLISTLLLFFCNTLLSQNIEVEYTNLYNTTIPNSRHSKLIVNREENTSYYQELFGTTKSVEREGIGEEKIVGSAKREMDLFIVTTAVCQRIIYDDFVLKKFLIEDNNQIVNWEISDEFKMIENLKAYKASTSFRGRRWIVWFTPDIPLPFGPWKLCGLPGLILEAADETKTYNFSATSIELNTNKTISLPTQDSFRRVSIKDFVSIRDDYYFNTLQSAGKDARDTTVTRKLNLRAGIESKFEWE